MSSVRLRGQLPDRATAGGAITKSAQVIARSGSLLGVPLWGGTVADQLRGRYDRARGVLR